MFLYSINLKVKGRKCVVVGGGKVAERKVMALLESGADVLVVSKELSPGLRSAFDNKEILALNRDFRPADLDGAFLAIAATDKQGENSSIASSLVKPTQPATAKTICLSACSIPELPLS